MPLSSWIKISILMIFKSKLGCPVNKISARIVFSCMGQHSPEVMQLLWNHSYDHQKLHSFVLHRFCCKPVLINDPNKLTKMKIFKMFPKNLSELYN